MARKVVSVAVLTLAGVGLTLPATALASTGGPPDAARDAGGVGTPDIAFDIPAQPLESALTRYGALSGRPVLFRSELMAGLASTPVHGRFTPHAALQILLQGTGLAASDVGTGGVSAFVLRLANPGDPVSRVPGVAVGTQGPSGYASYSGVVQDRIWRTLCDDPQIAPGSYRSLMRFQVDTTGHVRKVRLLASTGDGDRDVAILRTLNAIRFDRPPPPDLQQPLTMIILPRDAIGGRECGARPQ